MRGGRWLNVAALLTWVICGLPQIAAVAQREFAGWPALMWLTAYLTYGAALILFLGPGSIRRRLGYYSPLVLVAVQMVTALAVVMLPVVYEHGSNSTPGLLVVIAAQLPYLAPSASGSARPQTHVTLRPGWVWSLLCALTLLNTLLIFAVDRTWSGALSYGLSIGAFMLFAAASSFLVRSESAARDELVTVNTELLGTRALLAETSRVEERLRISRDLHDTLGHHLTALSLQLDVAARLSDGRAADHVRQAHAITRLLLSDVRDVVSRLRETSQLDLAQSIRLLAGEQADGPAEAGHYEGASNSPATAGYNQVVAIHLLMPDALNVEDTSRAEILLRSIQEIITNTARHAGARNLWIRLDARPDGIAVHARDDGRGADVVTCGNGLIGMRERFEQYGGRLEISAARGKGFEVRGFLPVPVPA
jgi:signal transduction histidine kinase